MFFSLFSFLLVSSFFFSHIGNRELKNDRRYFPLDTDHANRFLKRTFFHPGSTKCEEQKREAREDYGLLNFLFLPFILFSLLVFM